MPTAAVTRMKADEETRDRLDTAVPVRMIRVGRPRRDAEANQDDADVRTSPANSNPTATGRRGPGRQARRRCSWPRAQRPPPDW